MTLIQGVDASFDNVDLQEAQRLSAAGVAVFVQRLWTGNAKPPPRVTNLRNAYQAGLALAGYISLSGARDGALHVNDGRADVPDDLWAAMKFVAIDIELPGIPTREIRTAVERAVALGKGRCIYTSYGHWTGSQGNDRTFGDCLLWNALWDKQPDIDFAALPYGGWLPEKVLGEQWAPGSIVQGAFVDRNTFVRELVDPIVPPLAHPPTPGEFAALAGLVNSLRLRLDDHTRNNHP